MSRGWRLQIIFSLLIFSICFPQSSYAKSKFWSCRGLLTTTAVFLGGLGLGGFLSLRAVDAQTDSSVLIVDSPDFNSETDLVIANIGDSLFKDFESDERLSAIIARARFSRARNAFIDLNPLNELDSLFERIDRESGVRAIELASISSRIRTHSPTWINQQKLLLARRNMGDQVDILLEQSRLPDVVFIWMGHNDLPWNEKVPDLENPLDDAEAEIERQADLINAEFELQLDRLVSAAKSKATPTQIIIFKMVDTEANLPSFQAYLDAREEFGDVYLPGVPGMAHVFQALLDPELIPFTNQLRDRIDSHQESLVQQWDERLARQDYRVQVHYSTRLYEGVRPGFEGLTSDGVHYSEAGRAQIADLLWEEFLLARDRIQEQLKEE